VKDMVKAWSLREQIFSIIRGMALLEPTPEIGLIIACTDTFWLIIAFI
jgi:hypothetical protein